MNNKYADLNKVIKRFAKGYMTYSDEDKKVRDSVIKELKVINMSNSTLAEYEQIVWNKICDKVIRFNKDILLYVCEFIREMVCMNEFDRKQLDTMRNINEIALIMQKAIFFQWNKFTKEKWDVNATHLCELRELAYLYKLLTQNIEYAKVNNTTIKCEKLFDSIKDDKIDKYFEEYDKYFRRKKIEEEKIEDEKLNEYLKSKKLLPKDIKTSANFAIESTLGFNYEDLKNLIVHINVIQEYEMIHHHYCIPKEEFLHIYKPYIQKDNLEAIIKYLSISKLFEKPTLPTIREIELRCITEKKEILHFGVYNLLECINIFENISFTGQYLGELGIENAEMYKFTKLQDKFSTFFSYKVADMLNSYNYLLPKTDDGLICAEICELPIGSKKVLKFKDIDVLAVDNVNKILYNFELKHFKPAMGYDKVKKDKFSNKLFESFSQRHETIVEYKEDILESIFKIENAEEYDVRPVLISSRTNSKSREDIEYYTYESFKEKLQLREVI